MKHFTPILAIVFMIVACGSEREGGGESALQTEKQFPTFNDARIVPFESLEVGAERAAESTPSFTSTGISKSSVATDTVSASFHASPGELTNIVSTSIERADPTVNFTVTRGDGSSLIFDSSTQSVTDTIQKRALPPSPLRRHHLTSWLLFDYSESETLASNVAVSWHNDDPTDYLVAGYWMHLKGDLGAGSVENVDVGVFIDGPEFFSSSPRLPADGTALYRGRFAGMYTVYYDDPLWLVIDPRLVSGFKESGELSGEILLRVDFANKTIEGCVGCVENLETTGVTIHPDGTRSELYTKLSLASIKFAPAEIQESDGTFRNTDITTSVSEQKLRINDNIVPVGYELPTTGSWDGKFSSRTAVDESEHPGLVAGTTALQSRLPGGSRIRFVGSFFASKLITQ
ncbi:MAG: hypothetical protein OXK19_07865 [Candidatus Dadabacteria bacterium]|nr:hypothetical protein [Candidatus Dadabacteria bacterium]